MQSRQRLCAAMVLFLCSGAVVAFSRTAVRASMQKSLIPPASASAASAVIVRSKRPLRSMSSASNGASSASSFSHSLASTGEEQTEELGKQFAAVCKAGDTIFLTGDLGAGKTTFSRGFVRKLANNPTMRVTSPSYLLDNFYKFPACPVHHMDLYRLSPGRDVSFLGVPEIYATSICLIEWPDRIPADQLPTNPLNIALHINEDASREVRIQYDDEGRWQAKVEAVLKSMSS